MNDREAKKLRGADFSAPALSKILTNDEAFQGLFSSLEQRLFEQYAAEIIETNKYLNLTALTKADDMAYLHFLDSLSLLPLLDSLGLDKTKAIRFTDVGSGAGFPGIPVKIMRPNWQLYLLDALGKRVRFLNAVCANLGLSGIDAIHVRAEDAAHQSTQREMSDVVTARAVASLTMLAEYCLPLVKVGGYFIAMKAQANEEVRDAAAIINKLGGETQEIRSFLLPKVNSQRSLIVIKKLSPSPAYYPRPYAQIKQNT